MAEQPVTASNRPRRDMVLCAMPHVGGYHSSAWRRPKDVGDDIWDPAMWREAARTAERGKFHALFLADNMSLWTMRDDHRPLTAKVGVWDALIMASWMAANTERIGIVVTGSTEFHRPYILARQLASIDHLSGGRVGWNIVTSSGPEEAANFTDERSRGTGERYARATEFVDIVQRLWDSWEDDAYLIDKEAGIFFDSSKLHRVDYHSENHHVRGPLNIMRPPQGYPVLAQAGGSGPGKQLAGSVAELVFTPLSGEAAWKYRQDIRRIAEESGRDPDSVRVLQQIIPITGRTDAEAEDKWNLLQQLTPLEIRMEMISTRIGQDVRELPLDEPLPEARTDRVQGLRDAVASFRIDGRVPTVREIIDHYSGAAAIGSPSTLANFMEEQLDAEACDGFCVLFHGFPEDLNDFVDLVVPELQARGIFHSEYEPGSTFRERLGLARPRNRYAS